VHPTKREVHFLDEEAITERIADVIQENLAKHSQSRTFEYQVGSWSFSHNFANWVVENIELDPAYWWASWRWTVSSVQETESQGNGRSGGRWRWCRQPDAATIEWACFHSVFMSYRVDKRLLAEVMKRKVYSHHKVRTSTQDRTLDSLFPVANQGSTLSSSSSDVVMSEPMPTPSNTLSKSREIKESECFLTSVKNLRKQVQKGKHRRESFAMSLLLRQ